MDIMLDLSKGTDFKILRKLLYFSFIALIIGAMTGLIAVFFLKSVNSSIVFRKEHPAIIFLLPLAGFLVALTYKKFGLESSQGNNLIIDEIHESKKNIPFRMIPLIFISTSLSHLFGASVGREGAAVQMGGGISAFISKIFKVTHEHRRIFLMMGLSAGFSAIFGTPVAGAVFGIEVLFIGAMAYEALIPCVLASVVAFYTTLSLGVVSSHYFPIEIPYIEIKGIFAAIVAGILFGLTARLFIWSVHQIKNLFSSKIKNELFHPIVGGLILIIIFYAVGSDRYHSLGEEIIHDSFRLRVYPWDFLAKLTNTALSLGAGFKGGEVMSLFYMGSTLGNSLAFILPLDYPILAALGFVSVFAGAANVPIASLFLAFELFGSGIGVYAALAITTSYLFSGHKGIYNSRPGINQKSSTKM